MARTTTSFRLDDRLRAELAERANREGTTVTALVEELVREALAMRDYPGIVFRPGPTGRRAGLSSGVDVWEIVSRFRELSGSEAERVAILADECNSDEVDVITALNYYATHREEIDARVQANDQAWEEAERLEMERTHLLS